MYLVSCRLLRDRLMKEYDDDKKGVNTMGLTRLKIDIDKESHMIGEVRKDEAHTLPTSS